jgi:hypothetical protein
MFKQMYFRPSVLILLLTSLLAGSTACKRESREINRMPETLNGDIREETVWKNINDNPDWPDYIISGDIRIRSALTIEPGVVLHFAAGAALIIEREGTLIARGMPERKIVFTGAEPITGFWRGILFFSSDHRNELAHAEVSYGGGDPVNSIWLNQKAAIGLAGSSNFFGRVSLSHTLVSHSGGAGLYVQERAELNRFADNAFRTNTTVPLVIPASQVAGLDAATEYTGANGTNVVQIFKSDINLPTEISWPATADGTPYHITGDIRIKSGVRIQAGARLEFGSNTALFVDRNGGYLIARGTAAKPVVFTAENRTQPSWRGILFNSGDVRNEMDHTEVSYAGSGPVDPIWLNVKANIGLAHNTQLSARLSLSNSKIVNGGGWGVYVQKSGATGASLSETNNILSPNAVGEIQR